MKKFYAFLFIAVISASSALSQEFNFGLGGQIMLPHGDFKNNIDAIGGGGNLYGLYRFSNTPLALGFDLGFGTFGRDSRVEPLSTTIPDLKVQVDNSYNIVQALFMMRIQAPDGAVRPYVEGLAGWNYLFTETSISDRRFGGGGEPIASDTNFDDTAFAYGGGAGVMIRVFDWSERIPESVTGSHPPKSGYITLSTRYLYGNEAEYLKKGSITAENGNVTYDVSKSRTNMMMIQLGFVLRF